MAKLSGSADHSATPPVQESELTTLKQELETLKIGWQRTQADFENFRRRTLVEQTDRTASEVGRALSGLLPVADSDCAISLL